MPSILSRLRMRTISQHSTTSAPAPQLEIIPTPPPCTTTPALAPSRSEPQLVDRRIVEDLPALLFSLDVTQTPSGALRPPRPRKRSGLRTLGLRSRNQSVTRDDQDGGSEEKENEELPPTAPIAGPSAWKGKHRASGSRFSTTSPWSTFGRHRPRVPRSPYGSPPSARSSRIASVDSGVLRASQTASNVASTASVDHSNSLPTDNSHDVSLLSTLPDSGSNLSSHSHKSVAVTFGVRSPQPASISLPTSPFRPAGQGDGNTSMPILPSTYSTENVPSRVNTFPKRRHNRSRSAQRVLPQPFTTTDDRDDQSQLLNDLVMNVMTLVVRDDERLGWTDGVRRASDDAGERPAVAVPHADHALCQGTARIRPWSPRLIPPSLSSSSPTSRTLLDAENRSDGVTDNLSRSIPHTPDLLKREQEENWMTDPRDAASTLTRQPNDTRDTLRRGSSTGEAASHTGTPSRSRGSKRASQLSEQSISIAPASSSSKHHNGGAGPSSAAFPSITTPPPATSQRVPRTPRTASEPGLRSVSEKSGLETPVNNKGKRKAEDVDLTPPDQRTGQHATFVIPTDGRRSHHVSEVSKAPSSYVGRKRARLSIPSQTGSPSPGHSRPTSLQRQPTDSWPSRTTIPSGLHRATSNTTSMRSGARPESMSAHRHTPADRRRSMSEISFPISALVAPHAPSVSIRSGGYYMRDPRKPPRVQPTPWSLRLKSEDEQGSPVHAWMFFIGFILFPLWWFASFWRIPQTRRVGGTDTEKAVTLDDPQVEHDARSWRFRCRVMSVVSLLTYIPFIVLLAIFVPRS